MILRNGFKEYFRSGLIYGIIMGIFVGIYSMNFIIGIIMGIFAGALFGFLIFIFSRSMEKKFKKKRQEIAEQRRIICDGAATYNGNGGWLFFTETGLEFYPHKLNLSTKYLLLPIDKLKATNLKKSKIEVSAFDNKTFVFVVAHNTEWKNQIDGYFRNLSQNP